MIRRIEALRYRSLRDVDETLDDFHVLVGPNGSGKSSLLDVVAFLGDLLRVGPARAILGDLRAGVPQRAPDPSHLIWMQQGDRFELAVEVGIPEERRKLLPNGGYDRCRYEIAIGVESSGREIVLLAETLWLKHHDEPPGQQPQTNLFPAPRPVRDWIVLPANKKTPKGWRKVLNKVEESGNDYFFAETSGWNNPFRLGPGKSALANLPDDEAKFPVATWFKQVLLDGVQRIALSSEAMRRPSAPGLPRAFLPDGSNLPWVVDALERNHPEAIDRWVAHLRTALPDLKSLRTIERPEDRHRYLILTYDSGLEAPSWIVSDGTLRLLALTLLAYIPNLSGIYLIEEPENGIHPRAVETIFQALSSVYGAQILCATHSPLVVGMAKLEQLLCFVRGTDGATAIVRGSEHPRLKTWKGEVDLGTFFASGVLE